MLQEQTVFEKFVKLVRFEVLIAATMVSIVSHGLCRHGVWSKFTYISNERIASIFSVDRRSTTCDIESVVN